MTSVLQPRPCGTDVICGTLPMNLDQHNSILDVLAVPGVKGRQQLKTVAERKYKEN